MWSRKQAMVEAPPLETWPEFNESVLEGERLARYRAQLDALKRYFRNEPVRDIERLTGIARTDLPKLAKKCLLTASDGRIFGFRALEPYRRFRPYKRSAEVTRKRPEQQGGQAGALGNFLERFPGAEETMVRLIRQEAKAKEVFEFKLRPKDLHRLFISFAKKNACVTAQEWPLNTKYRGIRSIERFMKQVLDRNFARTATTRGERDAKAHISVGTGHEGFLVFDEPYDAVEIDAYDIEAHLTVAVATPEGTETDLLLERLWLIAAVERFSSAVLAYSVVYRSEVTAEDVLRVIRQAATGRWQPMELTLPLTYPVGGGLPSGAIPAAHGAVWSATLLDGALAHLANAIHDRARKTLGFVINWGAVGHFERRPNVERFFNQISKDLFKRLPSTTGSNPQKGRAKDAEKKAIQHRIRAAEVEQLLDVSVAQLNLTPNSGNSFLSPLESLRYFLEDPDRAFLVRRLPSTMHEVAKMFACREEVTVRGGAHTGRRPYVQLDKGKYTSPVLANAGHLVGQTLVVEIDEDDFRQIRAYLKNGAELGILKVQGKWARTQHSRRTRRAINSLVYRRVIVISEFDDPVQVYVRHLSQPDKGKTLSPKRTTELTRIAKEAGKTPTLYPPIRSAVAEPTTPDAQVSEPRPPVRRTILDSDSKFFKKIKNKR